MIRALVIDDDAVVRSFLDMVLTNLGYTVSEASDGVRGLECYRRERPDFVLCDLHMPLLDGLDTIRDLIAFDPNAKIIVMVGGDHKPTEIQIAKARRAGAVGRIDKPFNQLRLGIIIHSVLGPESEDPTDLTMPALQIGKCGSKMP